MPARRAHPSKSLLARQKAAAERLRREVLGADGSLKYPYFRDLRRQLKTYERPVDPEELFDACGRADLVYVGDFHAVTACQLFAAELLEQVARRSPDTALGVEFIYTRQQRLLDRRQSGLIDDETFLRRIHYREEWGYPWEGFKALLDRARDLDIPVNALDVPPRGGFEGLSRRDEHATRRIAAIIAAAPRRRLVVLFGESHLSRNHIPRRVRTTLKRLGLERSEVTVFQDPDAIYWQLVSRDEGLPAAVKLASDAYAVFRGNSLSKYEAYRQVLERWRGDVGPDEEVDLTPAVHHLIGVLLGWLEIRPNRRRLHHRGGWSEDLADAFPEVYSGREANELLVPILEEHGRTQEEVVEARALLSQRGALYESRSNTLFLLRYLPARAAGEGARFLRAALSGQLFDPPEETWTDPASRAYGAAYNHALAFLGSRLVDPTSDFLSEEERRALAAVEGSLGGLLSGGVAERIHWLEAHRRFEASRRVRPHESLLEPLRRSRPLRRALARDLGHRLGQVLFQRVRAGGLDSRGLRNLFRRRLTADRGQRFVIQQLRTGQKKGRA